MPTTKKILKTAILPFLVFLLSFTSAPNIYAAVEDIDNHDILKGKPTNSQEQKITEEELVRLFNSCEQTDVLSNLQKIFNAAKEAHDVDLSENILLAAKKTKKVIACYHPMLVRYLNSRSGNNKVIDEHVSYLEFSERAPLPYNVEVVEVVEESNLDQKH